eukprot:scaffold55646_cov29-Tisochrysis_lutea.AAC.5
MASKRKALCSVYSRGAENAAYISPVDRIALLRGLCDNMLPLETQLGSSVACPILLRIVDQNFREASTTWHPLLQHRHFGVAFLSIVHSQLP